jgi:hypothetical protein
MADESKQKLIIPGENGRGDQVFEYSSVEDLAEKFKQAQTNATRKIAEQEQALQEARAAVVPKVTPPTSNGFDQQHYLNLLASNPLGANKYIMGFEDAWPEDIREDYADVRTTAKQMKYNATFAAFGRIHPELLKVAPEDDVNNGKAIAKELTEMGVPEGEVPSMKQLEGAFNNLKAAGRLKLPQDTVATTTATTVDAPTVISSSSTSAPSATDAEEKFLRTAPLDQVRAHLEKEHAKAARA